MLIFLIREVFPFNFVQDKTPSAKLVTTSLLLSFSGPIDTWNTSPFLFSHNTTLSGYISPEGAKAQARCSSKSSPKTHQVMKSM